MTERTPEAGQDFIDKILSEGTHYGWENYGGDAVNAFIGADYPLFLLARRAAEAAHSLTVAEDEFFAEARRLGYDIEAG